MQPLKKFVQQGKFYQSVVDEGADIILIVSFEGEIHYQNNAARKTLGYTNRQLITRNFFYFIHPDDLPKLRDQFKRMVRKTYEASEDFQFRCADGSYRYFEFNSVNLKRKENVEGLILDCRDITQRKKVAAELANAQRAKEQFLANISHEIRTPINGIAGIASLLSQNPSLDEQRKYLDAIRSATENLKVIINDILDVASLESGKIRFEQIGFRLNDIVDGLVATFQYQCDQKGLRLLVDNHVANGTVLIGDPVRLNQVLINLLSNAIKFTHAGQVRLALQSDSAAEKWMLLIEVSDTGIGIPASKLPTIFERFSQADASITRRYGGTGLGLTIVKQLVELQGGSVEVESREHKGSTFRVALPFEIGKPDDVAVSSPAADEPIKPVSAARVLLVEDNEINQLYASTLLRNLGCACDIAGDGSIALKKLASEKYDLVLMDIQMPVLDGYETARTIRQSGGAYAQVPIIALTANASEQDRQKSLEAGMNDQLSKPFRPADLRHVLARYAAGPAISSPPVAQVDLTYLKQVAGGNQAFIAEMVAAAKQAIDETLAELHKKPTPAITGRLLHRLKPTLTLIGLDGLRKEIVEIEEKLSANQPIDLTFILQKLLSASVQLK
ncbi:MAG: response regulator [Cyclobacteriaceae bacterium]|nr:response regulator [Cyclobacteriaceae bacterium]